MLQGLPETLFDGGVALYNERGNLIAATSHVDSCTGKDRKFLLDCSGIDYISSAGLRVLLVTAKRCHTQQGEMVFAALQPLLQEVFKISGFDLMLKTFTTVKVALEDISPAAAIAYDGR